METWLIRRNQKHSYGETEPHTPHRKLETQYNANRDYLPTLEFSNY